MELSEPFFVCGSQYYDPETCRFINADTIAVISATPEGLTDKNLFAYCDNNPVMRIDVGGEFWHIIGGAVFGGVSSFISTLVTEGSLTNALISAAYGTVSGALSAAIPCASVLIDAAFSAAESITIGIVNNDDPADIAIDAAISAGFGAITGGWDSTFSNPKTYSDFGESAATLAKSTFTKETVHSTVKKEAKKQVKRTVKKLTRQFSWELLEVTSVSYLEDGTKIVSKRAFRAVV